MSTIIRIKNNKKVTAQAAIKRVLEECKASVYQYPSSQEPEDHSYCKLYTPNKSTKGVRIYFEKDECRLLVNIMSSEADLELAVNISKVLSKACGAPILAEGKSELIAHQDIDNGDLKQLLDENQLDGVEFIKLMMEEAGIAHISGLHADFYPSLEFFGEENNAVRRSKLLERFLDLQNMEQKGIRIPNPIKYTKNSKEIVTVVLMEGHKQLVNDCDNVVLLNASDDYYLAIPRSVFIENLGFECEMADQVQFIFPELNRVEFKNLMLKMQEFEIPICP